ncbi:DUF2199 domain-containing protein [Actinoplanes sp. NPDC049596]|uniref:DUF2199 domain-containing protein n=1 Tax=unclassified Actinoplanes TaxID=2626549 RepID=UPI003446E242
MTDQGYLCGRCGDRHEGLPFSYGTQAPVYWQDAHDGDEKSVLEQEICIIEGRNYFVQARIILPVHDADEDFVWGVWVSLSRDNFKRTLDSWDTPGRESQPSSFGWLSTDLPVYPSTINLKCDVHPEPVGTRPHIELEPTDHPLAVEQRAGITVARVQEIAEQLLHPRV